MTKPSESELLVERDRLRLAAPDLLAELEATASWLDERAAVINRLATPLPHGARVRKPLFVEVVRLRGRAAVIRQVVLKAKGAV